MPRPRLYVEPRVATAVRLPKRLHKRMQEAAIERDVSVNFIVVRAIERYLDQMLPVEEVQLERDARPRGEGETR